MLTKREQRIKDLLAKEMGGYQSYSEHRGIKDRIDPDFLALREKQLKFNFYLLWSVFVAFLCLWLGTLTYLFFVIQKINLMSGIFSAITSTGFAMLAYAQYQKKQMAFNIFKILAEAETTEEEPDGEVESIKCEVV